MSVAPESSASSCPRFSGLVTRFCCSLKMLSPPMPTTTARSMAAMISPQRRPSGGADAALQ